MIFHRPSPVTHELVNGGKQGQQQEWNTHLTQLLAECEAKARTSIAPTHAGVLLREAMEQVLHVFLRDAYACVLYSDCSRVQGKVSATTEQGRRQGHKSTQELFVANARVLDMDNDHASFGSELDGIAEKVGKDLSQSRWITDAARVIESHIIGDESDFPLNCRGKVKVDHFLDLVNHTEGNRLELQLSVFFITAIRRMVLLSVGKIEKAPCLNTCKIEDIVDEP